MLGTVVVLLYSTVEAHTTSLTACQDVKLSHCPCIFCMRLMALCRSMWVFSITLGDRGTAWSASLTLFKNTSRYLQQGFTFQTVYNCLKLSARHEYRKVCNRDQETLRRASPSAPPDGWARELNTTAKNEIMCVTYRLACSVQASED